MLDDTTREELLERAEAPAREAIRLHQFYTGKIEMWPKAAVRDVEDFATGTRPASPSRASPSPPTPS